MRYDIGLDLVASGGSLTLGSPSLTAHASPDGVAAQRLPDNWIQRFDGAYRSQNISWLTGVVNHSVDGPSTDDGYATNAVAHAALAALRTGGAQGVHPCPGGRPGAGGPATMIDPAGPSKPVMHERWTT